MAYFIGISWKYFNFWMLDGIPNYNRYSLNVLSRKVKELESKFGNLKKVVYDVINKGNSSAVEELGIGNVEEVEFTNSESSTQEDDSKSNRLNDAFADLDKQLADLQEIFNA